MVRGGIFPFFGMSFSCCWKDVRLKRGQSSALLLVAGFQLLLKGCTIEAENWNHHLHALHVSVVVERMYDWSFSDIDQISVKNFVSVVVERMYDWSQLQEYVEDYGGFSCCWKDVRLKLADFLRLVLCLPCFSCCWKDVRLKLLTRFYVSTTRYGFSCCWKDVRLKLWCGNVNINWLSFQLLLKGCTIEALKIIAHWLPIFAFQLLLKGCTIEALIVIFVILLTPCFSCCWKDVRLKLRNQLIENKWFLTVGFWSVFRKWSICTKSAIIFENLGWFGWLLDCFW